MKLAQPFVEQKRRLWFARRMRRLALARELKAVEARSERLEIMTIFPGLTRNRGPWPM